MPSDDMKSYKEMYEMGERLMQMAKDGGYNPDSADSDSSEATSDYSMDSKGGDQVSTALSMFKNG